MICKKCGTEFMEGIFCPECGMKYEGTMRSADWNNQGVHDVSYYALLKSEWKEAAWQVK